MGDVTVFDAMNLHNPTDVNQDRIRLWVDALRSGEYGQAKGVLCDGDNGYCCLGVACEVAIAHGLDIGREQVPTSRFTTNDTVSGTCVLFDNDASHLPLAVADWYGLESRNPWVEYADSSYTLAQLNDDGGFGFDALADLIEAKYCPNAVRELVAA